MILRKKGEVPVDAVEEQGASGVSIRWLISKHEGAPNFAMRLFDVAPGGYTPLHQHAWEHVVYILEGQAEVASSQGPVQVESGDAILVEPEEKHQFRNCGDATLRFLCMIPILE